MAVKYVINDETMTQIADPLRSLTGRTDGMTPAEMAAAGAAAHTEVQTQTDLIYQIKMVLNGKAAGGTGKPEQGKTANITENGEHEIVPDEGYTLSKVSVNVNVESSVDTTIEDGLITRTLTEYRNDRVTSVGDYAFNQNKTIKSVSMQNVTNIGNYGFCDCSNLVSVNFPLLTTVGDRVFQNTKVTSIDFPLLKNVGRNICYNGSNLETVNLPSATTLGWYVFYACKKLTRLDFPVLTFIEGYSFNGCTALETLILRSSTVCTLNNTTALASSAIANGTGYIYVPAALVEEYKAATNWSAYADEIRAIEDYPEITGG